ncbi:MAG: hypothetical protein J6B43_11135 [Lachnospiraceae bacterium]|nr:hypothetical protein [Lachnospiraceae bacterium]
MEKIKLQKNDAKLIKVELNDKGDYTAISPDDSTLFNRFVAGYKRIADLGEEIPKKLEEIEKKYADQTDFAAVMEKTMAMSKVNVRFSEEAVLIVDSIFGEGTIGKYFRNVYEEIPSFLPGAECFIDFFEQITPEMEKIFNRKMEERRKKSKERMAKYQPQDHKRPGGK